MPRGLPLAPLVHVTHAIDPIEPVTHANDIAYPSRWRSRQP